MCPSSAATLSCLASTAAFGASAGSSHPPWAPASHPLGLRQEHPHNIAQIPPPNSRAEPPWWRDQLPGAEGRNSPFVALGEGTLPSSPVRLVPITRAKSTWWGQGGAAVGRWCSWWQQNEEGLGAPAQSRDPVWQASGRRQEGHAAEGLFRGEQGWWGSSKAQQCRRHDPLWSPTPALARLGHYGLIA